MSDTAILTCTECRQADDGLRTTFNRYADGDVEGVICDRCSHRDALIWTLQERLVNQGLDQDSYDEASGHITELETPMLEALPAMLDRLSYLMGAKHGSKREKAIQAAFLVGLSTSETPQ